MMMKENRNNERIEQSKQPAHPVLHLSNTGRKILPVIMALVLIVSLVLGAAAPLTVSASDTVGGSQTSSGSDTPGKSDNPYNATIHSYYIVSNTTYYEYIYEYSSTQPLLVVYNRGHYLGSYLKTNMDSIAYFYVLSDDGLSAVSPQVTYVGYNYYSNGTCTETVLGSDTTLSYVRCQSDYFFDIEGQYKMISYCGGKYDLSDGSYTANGSSVSEIAYYYLKTGTLLNGWNAFSCTINSRSVLDNSSYRTTTGFSLLDATLEDGVFSYSGTVYNSDDFFRGGIAIEFLYKSGSTNVVYSYYRYQLPLTSGSYDFNFADIKNIKFGNYDCELASITVIPLIRYYPYSFNTSGTKIIYTAAQLEEAGCFENGGDPIVKSTTPDKGSGGSSSGDSGDPSLGDVEEEEHNYKGDTIKPDVSEWDDSEHGFWENVLHYLSNLASNIFNGVMYLFELPLDIADALLEKLGVKGGLIDNVKGISTSILDLPVLVAEKIVESGIEMWNKLMVPEADFTAKYTDYFNERFPVISESKEVMENLKERFSTMGASAPYINVPLSKYGSYGMSDMTMSFSWFDAYRSDFHALISAILWFGFLIRQYFGIKDLLNATGSTVQFFM